MVAEARRHCKKFCFPDSRVSHTHLPEMSERSVKLYVWLLLSARWEGSKRGWVEASFEDMATRNGCSTKTVQWALEELEKKPYMKFTEQPASTS
jgi:hypothetical protein